MKAKNESSTRTILIAGVGGQGIILAGRVISEALVSVGFDVKMAEVHGMAQRGGSVTTQIRFGRRVYSPISETVDYLVAFEIMEALRWASHLRDGGWCIVNDCKMPPAQVLQGKADYPDVAVQDFFPNARIITVCATDIARRLGNPRVANTAMLGALSAIKPFDQCNFANALAANIKPRYLDINRAAFDQGLASVSVTAERCT